MRVGLDLLVEERVEVLRNRRVGLVVNPTALNSRHRHAATIFQEHPQIQLAALFGPQHGIRGETQDNMIEWRGWLDPRAGTPVHSLYGDTRMPTDEMLRGVDVIVYDMQDVGTRVYTFIYTLANCMIAAAKRSLPVIVLDRPNPIGGVQVEGDLLDPMHASFVGMFPIPMRHGMTVGELALMFNDKFGIHCQLEIIKMEGWRRRMWFDDTGLTWIPPSPNIPTLDTATVYPGAVMVEGTQLSEGRGTTRPFELMGAPFIDPDLLAGSLEKLELPGLFFRPCFFQPAYHKYQGETCGGVQLHVTDRDHFKSVITGVALIKTVRELYPQEFQWKEPPYEYVFDRLPFDVINGGPELRQRIEAGCRIDEIEAAWEEDSKAFCRSREAFLLYS